MKTADFKNLLQGVREAGVYLRGDKRAAVNIDSISAKKKTTWSAYARARRASLKALFPDGPVLIAKQTRTLDCLLTAASHADPNKFRH